MCCAICLRVQSYSVEWKRKAFFKFVEVFQADQSWPKDLKAKVCEQGPPSQTHTTLYYTVKF